MPGQSDGIARCKNLGAAVAGLFFKRNQQVAGPTPNRRRSPRDRSVRGGAGVKKLFEVFDAEAKKLVLFRSWSIGRGVEQSGSSSGS